MCVCVSNVCCDVCVLLDLLVCWHSTSPKMWLPFVPDVLVTGHFWTQGYVNSLITLI